MKSLFIVIVGIEKDGNGTPLALPSLETTLREIKRRTALIFGGYSASVVEGGWLNPGGILVEEKALRLEIAASPDKSPRRLHLRRRHRRPPQPVLRNGRVSDQHRRLPAGPGAGRRAGPRLVPFHP